MKEKQLDELAGVSERLRAHRRRLSPDGQADEDVEIATRMVDTVVLFADHGKVPEELLNSLGHQVRGSAPSEAEAGPRGGRAGPRSGLGGTRRGQPTQRTW